MQRTLGNYQLQDEIARGAMGVVYRGFDPALARPVAIKVLLTQNATTEDLSRFRIEAMATARLRHPHIVGIQSAGEVNGKPYLVMDLIEGGSLKDRLKRGPLAELEAARLGEKLARALHYAHSLGILHRDVKPQNILLDARGEPLLTDFGLAKILDRDTRVTLSGEVQGTPVYMPPEQALGERDKIGPPADVYSLGATLYEVITGQAPFKGTTVVSVLTEVIGEKPTPPSSILQRMQHPQLESIVLRCLAKTPGDRFRTAGALADALQAVIRGAELAETGGGAAAEPAQPVATPPSSKGLVAGLVAGVALAGAVAAGVSWAVLSGRTQTVVAPEPPSPTGTKPGPSKENLARAAKLRADVAQALEEGRVEKALRDLERALKYQPASVEGHVLLGRAHLALDQAEKAEVAFATALDQEADHPDALVGHVRALAALGDPAEALRELEQAKKTLGETAEVLTLSGELALATYDYDAAVRACDSALGSDSKYWRAHRVRGQAKLALRLDSLEGLEDLRYAASADESAKTQLLLARGLINTEDPTLGEEGVALLTKLKTHPNTLVRAQALYLRGLHTFHSAVARRSRAALETALSTDRAQIEAALSEALSATQQALKLRPDFAPAVVLEGQIAITTFWDEASVKAGLAALERAMRLDPSDGRPYKVRGYHYLGVAMKLDEEKNPKKKDYYRRALKDLEQAHARGVRHLQIEIDLAYGPTKLREAWGWTLGKRHAARVLQLDPEHKNAHYWHGMAAGYTAKTDREQAEAVEELRRWIDDTRDPGNSRLGKIRELFGKVGARIDF